METEIRLVIKGIGGIIFGTIAFFLIWIFVLTLFPLFQWLIDGYFSFKEMKELIEEIYRDIFNMLTLKELREYIQT